MTLRSTAGREKALRPNPEFARQIQDLIRRSGRDDRAAPVDSGVARAEVTEAAGAVDEAYPDATARIRKLPKPISIERFQAFADETAMSALSQSYRHLGDALTHLAGATCTIEAPSATK